MRRFLASVAVLTVSGCAGIDFNAKDGEGLVYHESKPYLLVATSKDCVSTATVVAIPAARKNMKFNSGYGSSALSVSLSNGIVTAVGQTVDTKIPETITAVASLGTAVSGFAALGDTKGEKKEKQVVCKPAADLFPIVDGAPDISHAVRLPTPDPILIDP